MNKKRTFSIAILACILGLSINSHAFAEDMTPLHGIETSSNQTPDLYILVQKAKEQLAPVKLNYALTPHYKTVKAAPRTKAAPKQILANYTLDLKDIALAVLDPSDGQIKTVLAMQRGTDFTFPPQYGNFNIEKLRFNGVNTRFQVNAPIGGKVLALKYLITPKESGGKKEIEDAIYNGIYVPYSPELMDGTFTQKGAEYINQIIAEAAKSLAHKPSVSSPGKTIPEVIALELVRALIYAEHMDTNEFLGTTDTGLLTKKVDILLAGNAGDTWKYSVSTAGAAGISQFIPSTYAALVKRHGDTKLIPDFVTGMRDHVNAVKATFILLDDYIQAVKVRAPEHFLPGHAFDYGAAAYNGGPARVANAAKQYGTLWYKANFDEIAKLEQQISSGNINLTSIRAQFFASKDKALKARLQTQADNQRSSLKQLAARRDALQTGTLREETVHYLEKIHRLIQHFNSEPKPQVVASR